MALNGRLWKSLDFTDLDRDAEWRKQKWCGKNTRFIASWANYRCFNWNLRISYHSQEGCFTWFSPLNFGLYFLHFLLKQLLLTTSGYSVPWEFKSEFNSRDIKTLLLQTAVVIFLFSDFLRVLLLFLMCCFFLDDGRRGRKHDICKL